MNARRALQIGALALLVVLGAGLAYALLSGSGNDRVDLGGKPLLVRQELAPLEPQFGDTVVATTDVFTAPGVDPGSVRLKTSFAPYQAISTTRSIRRVGDTSVVRVVTRLHCLEYPCVPVGVDRKTFRFKPLQVSSGAGSVTQAWPALRVHSRLTKADSASPVVRVPPPVAAPVQFRGSPTAAGIALLVVAALLASAGAFLLLRVGLRRGERRVPPLERILTELTASCSNGDSGRRRRALESLAGELEPLDPSLSAESRVLAWGPHEPQPAAITDLTDRVRTAVRS